MALYTDMADEIYRPKGKVPSGVTVHTARTGPVTLTRVQIARPGLERPVGRYTTLELPTLAAVDPQDQQYIQAVAQEISQLLPPEGLVLVVGVGNRRITADALGPRTAGGVLVTRNVAPQAATQTLGLRPVAVVSPGASGSTGVQLAEQLAGLVRTIRPSAVVCVDSLCTADPHRLGRTVQLSDTGLRPAQPGSSRCVTRAMLGVPALALGVPTLVEPPQQGQGEGGLILVPRQLDQIVRKGSALLAAALNQALQPRLSAQELRWLCS